MSAVDSNSQPKVHKTIPAISLEVPKWGFDPPSDGSETAGEFRIVKGSETVHTWRTDAISDT